MSLAFSSTACAVEHENYDALWRWATVYSDDSNPLLQQFKWRGRYHGQYYDVNAENGSASGWEDRRSRFGFDAKLWDKKIAIRLDFQSDEGFEHFYDGLVDAYVLWKPSPEWSVTLGKQQPFIGHYDWITPGNELPMIERSQLFSQLQVNRATGLTVEGSGLGLMWQAGVYSNATPQNTGGSGRWGDGEWGDLDGGLTFGLGVGYDFHSQVSLDRAEWYLDWLHSERESGDFVLSRYDDIISTTIVLRQGPWHWIAEAYYAAGGDDLDEDVFGCYLMPMYDLVPDQWQLLARLSYSVGQGSSSIIAQSRYESQTPIDAIPGVKGSAKRGDEYHAIFLGAQHFFYGNQLKWMLGVEWAELLREGDAVYRGTTAMTGIRISF